MPKGSAKKGGKELIYIEAVNVEDIARFSCRFDSSAKELLIDNSNGKHRLVALAEGINEAIIAIYKEMGTDANTLRYTYGPERGEKTEFVTTFEQRQSGVCYIDIVDIDFSKMRPAKPSSIKNVDVIKVNRVEDLVKGSIKFGVMHDAIGRLYAFTWRGKQILGAFDLIDDFEGDRKTFYYSVLNKKSGASFARYRFASNVVDFSDDFGEHSYLYAKIVNLAEPFPFFKK
ncbi:MAG: hypothetical protein KGH61_02400 [Candidatus Micrarchaeota archaeon]|nr:hypothetical protein [Candidatus Micrarchaeota archaeon]MDE1847778.1 hypothetical protein [Candidatus Micrarchaeota archaeon]MDE1864216.1 hypothetical protein [Candidatus Micrarchaeota archaeon]